MKMRRLIELRSTKICHKVTNITRSRMILCSFFTSRWKRSRQNQFPFDFYLSVSSSEFLLSNVKNINAGEIFKYQTRTHILNSLNSFNPSFMTWSAFVCADYCQNTFFPLFVLQNFSDIFFALLLRFHAEKSL